jgi:hypothetical protein
MRRNDDTRLCVHERTRLLVLSSCYTFWAHTRLRVHILAYATPMFSTEHSAMTFPNAHTTLTFASAHDDPMPGTVVRGRTSSLRARPLRWGAIGSDSSSGEVTAMWARQ